MTDSSAFFLFFLFLGAYCTLTHGGYIGIDWVRLLGFTCSGEGFAVVRSRHIASERGVGGSVSQTAPPNVLFYLFSPVSLAASRAHVYSGLEGTWWMFNLRRM